MASTALTALPKSKTSKEPTETKPSHEYHNQASVRENPDFQHPDHLEASSPKYNPNIQNLTIVCCHAIFHPDISAPNFPTHNPHDEKNWHLAPFQQSNVTTGKPGEHETFLSHITAGLDTLTTGPSAMWKEDVPWNQDSTLLVFSGGATKPKLSSLSEARSYFHAAVAQELCQSDVGGRRAQQLFAHGRLLLEERATDSLQNLLFSILLFRRTTGRYPENIRVITHAFKSKRFLELHAPAVRWPSDRIQVQGIDPVMSGTEVESTLQGEEKFGNAPWADDPLGTGEVLSGKRRQRGWREEEVNGLAEGLEESVKELLGGKVSDELPWAQMPKREVKIVTGPPPFRY